MEPRYTIGKTNECNEPLLSDLHGTRARYITISATRDLLEHQTAATEQHLYDPLHRLDSERICFVHSSRV